MVITSLGESTKEKESLADGDFNGPYASFCEPDSSKMAFSAAVNFAIPTLVLRLTKYLQTSLTKCLTIVNCNAVLMCTKYYSTMLQVVCIILMVNM